MSSDRTEKPTAKRLKEARDKGQLPRSRDLGQAASLFAAVTVLSYLGGHMHGTLVAAIQSAFGRAGEDPLVGLGPNEVSTMATEGMWTIVAVAGPLALAAAITVVAMQSAQGGFLFATEALTPDLSRLSPAKGIKRLGPSQGGLALLKAFVACAIIAFLAWKAVHASLAESLGLTRMSAVSAAQVGWTETLALIRQASIALFMLAGFDYGVQRYQFMKGQKMTKKEVKDEHRLQEGDPQVKSRVRRIQMDLVRRRMMAAVQRATVVVTNPTHYAVALEYDRSSMAAPRIVAKGRGFVALRIRELARQHGVPIVENPPLARALHKHAEVGDVIPAALFEAVAEVLAYLIRLRQLVL
jgi:flagellar biosynthetic protein FlhB